MTCKVRCFVGPGIAGMAALPDVSSDSNGRSSPGNVGLSMTDLPAPPFEALELVAPGLELVAPGLPAATGDFAAAGAGFAPGFPFIDAPQNGQSTASSSRTD